MFKICRKKPIANKKAVLLLVFAVCFISLFSAKINAQNQNAGSKSRQAKVAQFLEKQGTYTKIADGAWTVPYQGKSIKNIEVMVIAAAEVELLIMAVKVAAKDELPLKPDLLYKILKFSADQVKVTIDDNGDLAVQAEINARLTDYKEFSEVIGQVSAAADILRGQIKSSLISTPVK